MLYFFSRKEVRVVTLLSICIAAASSQENVPAIYKEVEKAVVRIETQEKSGTGFFAFNGQYLITAAHVIQGSQYIEVDGDRKSIASIDFYDSRTDIAILKMVKHSKYSITFRSKDDLEVGSKVYVVSNQLGLLEDSITDGILSSYREERQFLQFTASVNPGSSGAPLLDSSGKVIGLVSFQMKDSNGLAFAIGIRKLRQSLSEAIKRSGKRENINSHETESSKKVTIGKLGQALEELSIYRERDASSEVLSKADALQYLVISKIVDDWAGVVLVNGKIGWVPESKIIQLQYDVQIPMKM